VQRAGDRHVGGRAERAVESGQWLVRKFFQQHGEMHRRGAIGQPRWIEQGRCDRAEFVEDVDQCTGIVAATGGGDQARIVGEHAQCVDVPAVAGEPLATLAQAREPLRQLPQERIPACRIDRVRNARMHHTHLRFIGENYTSVGAGQGLTTTSSTIATSSRAGTSLKILSQRLEWRLASRANWPVMRTSIR
jgi:hypothetical protein